MQIEAGVTGVQLRHYRIPGRVELILKPACLGNGNPGIPPGQLGVYDGNIGVGIGKRRPRALSQAVFI